MQLNVTMSPPNPLETTVAQLLFGNWSVVCSNTGTGCRHLGHIAILGAVPSVVSPLAGGGEVSFSGPTGPWSPVGGSFTFLSKFDDLSTEPSIGASSSSDGDLDALPVKTRAICRCL
jgi:hypothetical protein